jgi:hypothetical protein
MELEAADRGTGTDLYGWLHTQLMDLHSRTDQPLPAKIIYSGPISVFETTQTDFGERVENITDPNAQKRSAGHGVTEMALDLSRLASAARLLIPGLRDMTSAEKANLRQYYKRFYRKG